MPRTIEQTEVADAFASLRQALNAAAAAYSEAEAYYRRAAGVDLEAHPQMAAEALSGFLQRMDGLARILRSDALGAVGQVWAATGREIEVIHREGLGRSAIRDREARDRLDSERVEAVDAAQAETRAAQREVNRLLREGEEEPGSITSQPPAEGN
jgi:hypothetical protein